MKKIDLDRIRKALPNRAKVSLVKYNGHKIGEGSPAIRIFIPTPSLSENDFKMCMQWQREIIGEENISEFYTEETGRDWFIFLNRMPFEFINVTDDDINSFTNLNLVKNGILIKD